MDRKNKRLKLLLIISFFIIFSLSSCTDPPEYRVDLTVKNTTEYVAEAFPNGWWDDGSFSLDPGEEKTDIIMYRGTVDCDIRLIYSMEGQSVDYLFTASHDDHIIITIFAPGQGGFSVEKERL